MAVELSLGSKLAHNVGLIVLASQNFETHLKIVVAASQSSDTGSVIDHHKKLQRRALGEVVNKFLGNVTVTEGNASDLERYFSRLLDRRNNVVHHFFATYGQQLNAGKHKEVLADLAALCEELRHVAAAFKGINEAWLEQLQSESPVAS